MNERRKGASSWLLAGLVGLLAVALWIPVYSIARGFGSDKVYLTTKASTAANQAPGSRHRARGPGKQLFIDNCGLCHTLTAAAVSGSGGPSLDQFKGSTEEVLDAIESGGSGSGAMPKNLVTGREAVQLTNFLVVATGGKPKKVSLRKLTPKTKTINVKIPPKPKPAAKEKTAGGKGTTPGKEGAAPTGGGPGGPGKQLFVDSCGSCHKLKAAGTKGTAGPPLDGYKGGEKGVLDAIKKGGKSGGMPKNLVTGKEAKQIAEFMASAIGG